ncbi:MAG TPA: PaaI family thioesterase [Baekduia sp.]|uniref:PaaI family thioesterase n=1 Tax=Baekduia sp. TaxID=2600305 RepID=UPI002D768E88|nr:PaaI family thioesterase [Baekduia sp.]HET6505352.1 PaaI family thioesterase [Baekduia sp.]
MDVSKPAPYDEFYGLEVTRCDALGVAGSVVVQPHHLQPMGLVHGGVYASIGEALASLGTNWHVAPDGLLALGMTNATSFMRPIADGAIHGTAEPRHQGRSTWVWDVDMRDDAGALCAVSRVTLAVRPAARAGLR